MPGSIYRKNEKNGIICAYESVSYWDKEKKQPCSIQKYLGNVDPETYEIIPKKQGCRKKIQLAASDSEEVMKLLQENNSLPAERQELRTQNAALIKENE